MLLEATWVQDVLVARLLREIKEVGFLVMFLHVKRMIIYVCKKMGKIFYQIRTRIFHKSRGMSLVPENFATFETY